MKRTLFAVLVVGAIAFVGPRAVSAQGDSAIVKVPFQFIVGDSVLPAGTYRMSPDTQDPTLLYITSTNGKASAAFAATGFTRNPTTLDSHVHVQFKNVDGQYFLWQVAMPGADTREVSFTKAQAEHVLAKLNLMPAERADVAK